jgi:predicted nuclease with TOPRIM domain
MIPHLDNLKHLEELVKQACQALHKTATENRNLKERLERIESEHKRVREELRDAKLLIARHERLRSRLLRLSERLEKVS